MASTLEHLKIDDYDTWKREIFDADPAGRSEIARSHVIYRDVDDPSQVFIRVEFESAQHAAAFRRRLMQSGVLEEVTVIAAPTVVEVADSAEYRPADA